MRLFVSALATAAVVSGESKCAPEGWRDSANMACADYQMMKMCTDDGKESDNWDDYMDGVPFTNYKSNGYDASHCKECGCVEDDGDAEEAGDKKATKCAPDGWKDKDGVGCDGYVPGLCGKDWLKDFAKDGYDGTHCKICGCTEDDGEGGDAGEDGEAGDDTDDGDAEEAGDKKGKSKCAPEGWTDSHGDNCLSYGGIPLCTSTGAKTSTWAEGEEFADYAKDGYDGSHCKECGCVEDADGDGDAGDDTGVSDSGGSGSSGPPPKVNGNWGSWSNSGSCTEGKQLRTRLCNNPPAANNGENCLMSDGEKRGNTETQEKDCSPPKDPCDENNGGCSRFATCNNFNGQASCKCKDGFSGNGQTCRRESKNIVRGTKAMGFAKAQAFCKTKDMTLPRPENDAENNELVEYGETWLGVLVNALLDEDREYGNWQRRLRAYLQTDGKWKIAGAAEEREFFCRKEEQPSCSSQMNADWFTGGNWQVSPRGSRIFSQMEADDLDTLDFGSRVRFNCGFGRSQSFICVRDRNGGQFFAKCKNRNCGAFVRRKYNFDSKNFLC